jgi:hypothetical protein
MELTDGRQTEACCGRGVVEADDRKGLRDPQAARACRLERAPGEAVREAQDRRRPRAPTEQRRRRGGALIDRAAMPAFMAEGDAGERGGGGHDAADSDTSAQTQGRVTGDEIDMDSIRVAR